MKSERTLSMRLTPAFRCTWLPGVILLLAAATGWAQAGNVSTAARQDLNRPRTSQALPGPSADLLAKLESIYKDIHANPELSMQEQRTAGIAADWLRQHGYEVTEKIGGTGVVGLLRNGEGATVLLRADMDALPMKENTGLPYASTKTGKDPSGVETAIAHSCGHDMHVTWLMGATQILAAEPGQVARHRHGRVPAGGGNRRRGQGHGRGRDGQALSETRHCLRPTRDVPPRWPDRHTQRTRAVHVG